MQAFQKDLKKFEGLNAQVLGISGDSLETHKKFSDEYKLQFPLIADVSEPVDLPASATAIAEHLNLSRRA